MIKGTILAVNVLLAMLTYICTSSSEYVINFILIMTKRYNC